MNTSHYDVIIIGSGAGGAAAAYTLVRAGLRVALIEKGPEIPPSPRLDHDPWAYTSRFQSQEPWLDQRGRTLVPQEYFNLGGKTHWYGAGLLRFERHEFEADPAHQCPAWGLSLDALTPYYEQAEALLGVSCFECEHDLAHILQRLSPDWQALPFPLGLAKDIQAQYAQAQGAVDSSALMASLRTNAETSFLAPIRNQPHCHLIAEQAVQALVPDPHDPKRIAGIQLADGRELTARAVVLAAGALHSPGLLERYLKLTHLTEQLPSAQHIGRHLKLHLYTIVIALSSGKKQDVIRKTRLLLNKNFPHSRVEPLSLSGQSIAAMLPSFLPRALTQYLGQRAYLFLVQTEEGSHPDNRVRYTEQGRVFDYDEKRTPAASQEHRQATRSFVQALKNTGAKTMTKRVPTSVTAHACGTLMAGLDPTLSVVHALTGQVHGLASLYVVDASTLPRSGRMTPTLTLFANSLRVATQLAHQLKS
jgi:choline dehydrogenase-like flavoprotein